jgi:hypothetical protein
MASASTSPACHQVSSSPLIRPRVRCGDRELDAHEIDGFRCDSCLHTPAGPHHPAETPLGFDATAAGLATRPRPASSAALAIRSRTSWVCTRTATTARKGSTLPGAAIADPSQEEAPAAAEPAGDGRPSPGWASAWTSPAGYQVSSSSAAPSLGSRVRRVCA